MDGFYCEPDFDKVNEIMAEVRESMLTDEERKQNEEEQIAFLQSLTDDERYGQQLLKIYCLFYIKIANFRFRYILFR